MYMRYFLDNVFGTPALSLSGCTPWLSRCVQER